MTQRHPVQNDIIMHITTVTRCRYPFFDDPTFAREAVDVLYRTQSLHPFFLFGFAIMPDHCHFLMMVPPPETISMVMKSIKTGVTGAIGFGSLWQPRFHIAPAHNPWRTLAYIHTNPVQAGIVDDARTYPWSSASGRWDVSPLE